MNRAALVALAVAVLVVVLGVAVLSGGGDEPSFDLSASDRTPSTSATDLQDDSGQALLTAYAHAAMGCAADDRAALKRMSASGSGELTTLFASRCRTPGTGAWADQVRAKLAYEDGPGDRRFWELTFESDDGEAVVQVAAHRAGDGLDWRVDGGGLMSDETS